MKKERIDPNLVSEWNEKLAEEGLPIIRRERVPIEAVNPELAPEFNSEMESLLEMYESLSPELKADIVDDLKKQRSAGMTYEKILDRLELLAESGVALAEMPSVSSDVKLRPESPVQEVSYEKAIDDLITRMEKSLGAGKKGDSIH